MNSSANYGKVRKYIELGERQNGYVINITK